MVEYINQANVRYYNSVTYGLEWKPQYWNSYWRTDINTCLNQMKTPTKAFVVANMLQQLVNHNNNTNTMLNMSHTPNHLGHLGGCRYEVFGKAALAVVDEYRYALKKYFHDIDVHVVHSYRCEALIIELGKTYSAKYRRELVTMWKLSGQL